MKKVLILLASMVLLAIVMKYVAPRGIPFLPERSFSQHHIRVHSDDETVRIHFRDKEDGLEWEHLDIIYDEIDRQIDIKDIINRDGDFLYAIEEVAEDKLLTAEEFERVREQFDLPTLEEYKAGKSARTSEGIEEISILN
jgi:hypothetical protein